MSSSTEAGIALYPLAERRPDLLSTGTGAPLESLTVENLASGTVSQADIAISADALRLQAGVRFEESPETPGQRLAEQPEHRRALVDERPGAAAGLAQGKGRLEPAQRVKWIGVAKRYSKMTPIGQKRVQTRMKKWAKLTPEQRKQARENYRRISKVPPEKRGDLQQQWDEYQSLPPRKKPAPAK